MNRSDVLAAAKFYHDGLRREARARRKRYPAAAEQLTRLAAQVGRQMEEIKHGPLFAETPKGDA
jgi:hypothetical protein